MILSGVLLASCIALLAPPETVFAAIIEIPDELLVDSDVSFVQLVSLQK